MVAHNRGVAVDPPADPPIDRPAGVGRRGAAGEVRAAIDLGTNSFHLVVARVDDDGQFDVLDKAKEVVRLGSGAGEMRLLTPDAIERGLSTLGRFKRIADSLGATIDAVATSALREAANREEFVRRAHDEVGIDVEVVSGAEEARLIHLGVLQAVPLYDERILVIDIGGGSTELIVGEGTDALLARSLKLGAIRLTDRFFPDGRARRSDVADCRSYVRSFLAPAVADVSTLAPFAAVGSSGTILTMARIIAAAEGRDPNAVVSGDGFTADALGDAVETVLSHKTAEARAAIEGLDERRQDIIPAGAILLQEILDMLGVEQMVVSDAALREGILIDRSVARDAPGVAHHLSDIRHRSVMRMAEAYHEDLGHIERSTELALQLFDGLSERHGLGDAERDLLEAAGLLHNVGLFISHAAHHRHSYYVIRHTDQLVGFSDREVELIAQIARYHRKSAPKRSHDEFHALAGDDQRRVRLLAGMLRVGIALDRTRRHVIEKVTVRDDGPSDVVTLNVHRPIGADVALERYVANDRSSLLAAALDAEVRLAFVDG